MRFIADYDVSKGGQLCEAFGSPDANGWKNIGECGDLYLMADPWLEGLDWHKLNKEWGNEYYDYALKTSHMTLTSEKDGTGANYGFTIPSWQLKSLRLYPQYANTIYDYILFGKPKEVSDEQKRDHEILMSKCFIVGDEMILHHNSKVRITDGVIRRGTPNIYTPKNFNGICFWASRNDGCDPSGGQQYTYYCRVPLNKVYDSRNNVEGIRSNSELYSKYPYEISLWEGRGDAVVCTTDVETPIWCVHRHYTNGSEEGWYDKSWNKISKPDIL